MHFVYIKCTLYTLHNLYVHYINFMYITLTLRNLLNFMNITYTLCTLNSLYVYYIIFMHIT